MIPTIQTERLCLVPPSAESFGTYEKFYTNSAASKFYGGPISKSQAWTRLKADLGSWYLLGFGVWVIQLKESNKFLGTCGFWEGYGWPRELTWWLLSEARGKGYAFEASTSVISHAYNIFGWDKIETYMNDDNRSAQALVERLGGTKIRRSKFPDGLERNVYMIPKQA